MQLKDLLREPITNLNLDESFCTQCRAMGFSNLEDILLCPPKKLVSRPGFTYAWLGVLADFLNEKQLLHLLQSAPGKNSG